MGHLPQAMLHGQGQRNVMDPEVASTPLKQSEFKIEMANGWI